MAFHLEHTQWWDLLCFIPLSKIGAFLTLSHERPPPGVLGYHGASTNSPRIEYYPHVWHIPAHSWPKGLPLSPSPQASRSSHCKEERKKRIGQAEKGLKLLLERIKKRKMLKTAEKKKGMHNYYKSLIKKLENNPSHDKAETFHIDLCL